MLGGKEPQIEIDVGRRNDDSKLISDAATNRAMAGCWCKRQASPCSIAHLRYWHWQRKWQQQQQQQQQHQQQAE